MTAQQPNSVGFVGQGITATLVNTVVVYDRKDGRIVHTHQFVTIGSRTPRTYESMEQTALEFLKPQAGGSNPDFAVLHLHQQLLKPHTTYRVDLTTSRLVEMGTVSSLRAEKQEERKNREKES